MKRFYIVLGWGKWKARIYRINFTRYDASGDLTQVILVQIWVKIMENSDRAEKNKLVWWQSSWMVRISRSKIFRRNRTIRLSKIPRSSVLAGSGHTSVISEQLFDQCGSIISGESQLKIIFDRGSVVRLDHIRATMMQQITDQIVQMVMEVMIMMKIVCFWTCLSQMHSKLMKNDRLWFGFMVVLFWLDLVPAMTYHKIRYDNCNKITMNLLVKPLKQKLGLRPSERRKIKIH